MDRAQPGARGSTNRNIEFGETTGQYTDGWIVPADDPTLSAQRYTSLDETAFNEFAASHTASSLTVTIDPGEAFVDGWLARDVATDIDLAADTIEQTIMIGWDPDAIYDDQQHDTRDEADRVIVDLKSNVDSTYPVVAIWEFDTDETGVVSARDVRTIGQAIDARTIDGGTLAAENPDRLPIAELDDEESIEVYRWGAYDISDATAPTGLDVELLDGSDTVQASTNTVDDEDDENPLAEHTNGSGTTQAFKLRAINETGDAIDNPGVAAHFGFRVV
jgi:hypothetical protein